MRRSLRGAVDDSTLQGHIIISDVHRCHSYARRLSAGSTLTSPFGSRVDSTTGVLCSHTDVEWVRSTTEQFARQFQIRGGQTGSRVSCPLFRFVSIEKMNITGMASELKVLQSVRVRASYGTEQALGLWFEPSI